MLYMLLKNRGKTVIKKVGRKIFKNVTLFLRAKKIELVC